MVERIISAGLLSKSLEPISLVVLTSSQMDLMPQT
jgi:hypothetical protein